MSDLEEDVLMQLIEVSKRLNFYKERADLLEEVWMNLDRLLRAMALNPTLMKRIEPELDQLKKSVVAVLDYDKERA